MKKSKERSILNTLVRSTVDLSLVQAISRLLPFMLNIAVARRLTPAVYGTASVHFQLVVTTILALAKDPVRRACSRVKEEETVRRGSFAAIVAGILVGIVVVSLLWIFHGSNGGKKYLMCLMMMMFAAWIELLGEPVACVLQHRIETRKRLYAEGMATVGRGIVSFSIVYLKGEEDLWALVAIPIGQVVYSVILVLSYIMTNKTDFSLKLRKWTEKEWEMVRISAYYFTHSLLKHILTDGEKAVLMATVSLEEQGLFALVENIGGLVARVVFQPIEEISFSLFGRISKPNEKLLLLEVLTRGMMYLGLLCFVFLPLYSREIWWIFYGGRDVDKGGVLLVVYGMYLFVVSINGVTEAFVHATATKSELTQISFHTGIMGAVFLLYSIPLSLFLGGKGAILANGINMVVRIVYSFFRIHKWSTQKESSFSTTSIIPHWTFLFVLLSCCSIILLLKYGILVGIVAGVLCLTNAVLAEKNVLQNLTTLRI